MQITVRKLHDKDVDDQPKTPEERLSLVESLRIEAGKFLYEYPTAFRRVISVIRKK